MTWLPSVFPGEAALTFPPNPSLPSLPAWVPRALFGRSKPEGIPEFSFPAKPQEGLFLGMCLCTHTHTHTTPTNKNTSAVRAHRCPETVSPPAQMGLPRGLVLKPPAHCQGIPVEREAWETGVQSHPQSRKSRDPRGSDGHTQTPLVFYPVLPKDLIKTPPPTNTKLSKRIRGL